MINNPFDITQGYPERSRTDNNLILNIKCLNIKTFIICY